MQTGPLAIVLVQPRVPVRGQMGTEGGRTGPSGAGWITRPQTVKGSQALAQAVNRLYAITQPERAYQHVRYQHLELITYRSKTTRGASIAGFASLFPCQHTLNSSSRNPSRSSLRWPYQQIKISKTMTQSGWKTVIEY